MKTKQHPHCSVFTKSLLVACRFAVVVIIALCVGKHSFAGGISQYSIGLKFGPDATGGGGGVPMAPTDVAGLPAVSQANWNNMPTITGTTNGAGVVDNSGAATSAGVTWVSPTGVWASGGNNAFPAGTDHNLMLGYLDNGGTATITITNLPSQLTTSGYDVYVYALYDTANRGGTYSIVDGLNTATVIKPAQPFNADAGSTNYAQCPGANTNQSGNYLVFHGITNQNIQVVAVANHGALPRAIVCAVELVAAPAPGEAGPATGVKASTNGLTGQMVISWTNGASSDGALVVMRQGIQQTAEPVDGTTYTASNNFAKGQNLGDDEIGAGNYAVFSGPTGGGGVSNYVTVTNLTPTVTYYATVYQATNIATTPNYTLATPGTASAVAAGN